jgi:MFS transporter, putative metabolite:H+ symporter
MVSESLRVPVAARINRLPLTQYYRKIAAILGFIFFFDMADINTFSFASPAIIKFWHVSISTIAVLTSGTFAGMFIGSTVGGWVSDKIGRKRALIFTTIWYAGFSLCNAFAVGPISLFATRLLTGVGISAMTVVGISYISEIFPARVRGSYQGWIMVVGLLGVPATAYVARFVIPLAPGGWRLVFVWGALGILFPLFASSLEESPRWYENHGRFAEADAVLDRMESEIVKQAGILPAVVDTGYAPPRRGSYTELINSAYLPRTSVLIFAWIFTTLGFFGFTSWVPTLLVAHGLSLVHSLTWSSAMSLATIPGAVLAALFSDRWDRKWSIAILAIVIAICGTLYGMTFHVVTVIVFGMFVEMFIHMLMPLMFAYTAESFPSEIRNSGTGLAYGAGRLANVLGPLIIAFLFRRYGYTSVFIYISTVWMLVALLIGGFGLRSRTLT